MKKKNLSCRERISNLLFSRYKACSKYRRIAFFLNKEDFINIIFKSCHYCGGQSKVNTCITKNCDCAYKTVGVDRLNSDLPYDINNCVPCCSLCNSGKLKMTEHEFISHAHKIYNYRINNNERSPKESL